MKRLLLFGYFGMGNFGDDLLLWTICLRLGRLVEKGDVEITVLCDRPYEKLPIPVNYASRKNIREVAREISRSDVVCAPGGGLLQDKTSLPSLLYYLNIIRTAKSMRKKTALLAQGIGPISSYIGRFFARRILSGMDYFSVRDEGSASLIEKLGVKSDAQVTSDLTFALSKVLMPGEIRPAENSSSNEINILVCPKRFGDFDHQVSRLCAALYGVRRIYKEKIINLKIAALHAKQDLAISSELAERLAGEMIEFDQSDPVANYTHFMWPDVVLSYRLHGCVMAAQSRRPFVAISYDPKVSSLAKNFDQRHFDPEIRESAEIGDAVAEAYKKGFGRDDRDALNRSQAASEKDIDALTRLIQGD